MLIINQCWHYSLFILLTDRKSRERFREGSWKSVFREKTKGGPQNPLVSCLKERFPLKLKDWNQ
jgi:hypothetical protein